MPLHISDAAVEAKQERVAAFKQLQANLGQPFY